MARQVKQLQMENSNMYFIKDENVSLKDELAGVRKQLSMRNEAPLDGGERQELEALRINYRNLVLGGVGQAQSMRPITPADVREEVRKYDDDLAELMARNQKLLDEAKSDMRMLKREVANGGGIDV